MYADTLIAIRKAIGLGHTLVSRIFFFPNKNLTISLLVQSGFVQIMSSNIQRPFKDLSKSCLKSEATSNLNA